ncbi:MAG: DUF4276 family protein [Sedimentisphaerales bacterium]|nr:DUF4276 family protein [Sedimentisphaerales bacterium]
MVTVKVYVEGGGEGDALRTECRRGFRKLIENAGFKGRMPGIVACGRRRDAYEDFCTAVENAAQGEFPLLLVDSEAPVSSAPWDHLKTRDGWDRPAQAVDGQAHLMVQCMEAWFLADRDALTKFFGQGFRSKALPQNREVEEISKEDLSQGMERATRDTHTKGAYEKGKHSFKLLATLDPSKVQSASEHARRFFDTLRSKLGG